MKMIVTLTTWLLVLGGIVLGYEAVFGKNLLHVLSGVHPMLETIVAVLIGISALFVGYTAVTKKI